MARGFGTTSGVTNNDYIQTSINASHALTTWSAWVFANGTGGGGKGRILNRGDSSEEVEGLHVYDASQFNYYRRWSGFAEWRFPGFATGQWIHVCVTYDSGSTANDPNTYVNGSLVSETETSSPSGSLFVSTDTLFIGNIEGALNNGFNGVIAEVGVWNRILSAEEVAALAKGVSPAIFGNGLTNYFPLIRNAVDLKNNAALTVSGTQVQPHSRVFYPASARSNVGRGIETILRSAAGTVTPEGALRKTLNKSYAGIIEYTRSLFKRINLPKAGTIGSSATAAALRVAFKQAFTGAITPTGAATFAQVVVYLFAGTVGASGSLSKRVSKVLSAEITPGNSLLSYLIYPWYLVGQIAYRVGRRKA